MADESNFTRVIAQDVAVEPTVNGFTNVQDVLTALGVVPVAGTATTFGLYGATPVAQAAAIPDPTAGSVIDIQARAAIVTILDVLGAAGGGIGITA